MALMSGLFSLSSDVFLTALFKKSKHLCKSGKSCLIPGNVIESNKSCFLNNCKIGLAIKRETVSTTSTASGQADYEWIDNYYE